MLANTVRNRAMPEHIIRGSGRRRHTQDTLLIMVLIVQLATISCSNRENPAAILVAGGDCLLDRYNGIGHIDPREDHRWDTLIKAVAGSNSFLFNLETTIGKGGSPKDKLFTFQAPVEALKPLVEFPKPVAALANNHTMDYGPSGLIKTIEALDKNQISHTGAGKTIGEAWTEARIECPGGTLSILACGFDNDETSYADTQGAAIAGVAIGMLKERIAACRKISLAVVVMLHWGTEYDTAFSRSQQFVARSLVDAGADLLIGSGPHVLQGLEEYHKSLICYSLGNLIFDDLSSEERSASLLVRMILRPSPGGLQKEFLIAPLRTRQVPLGPSCPSPDDAKSIIEAISLRSSFVKLSPERPFSIVKGIPWYKVGD
jgi:poly-gamma-glutamate capsule biosynthesis protein CapA/YwtB (metallophosphatase superfamily)